MSSTSARIFLIERGEGGKTTLIIQIVNKARSPESNSSTQGLYELKRELGTLKVFQKSQRNGSFISVRKYGRNELYEKKEKAKMESAVLALLVTAGLPSF